MAVIRKVIAAAALVLTSTTMTWGLCAFVTGALVAPSPAAVLTLLALAVVLGVAHLPAQAYWRRRIASAPDRVVLALTLRPRTGHPPGAPVTTVTDLALELVVPEPLHATPTAVLAHALRQVADDMLAQDSAVRRDLGLRLN